MRNTCAVSILVPICNVQNYLAECLDSLVNQTLTDLQIICIDDGSTDASPDILEEYSRLDRRIEVITKPNSGYGDSMNKGLEIARGEYIGIVESDDFASPDMFEVLYNRAKRLDADLVKENFFTHLGCSRSSNDALVNNIPLARYGVVQLPGSEDVRQVMLMQPAIWSGIYRKGFLDDNNIRFLPTPGASFQDTSFNFKTLALSKRSAFFPTAHLHYRIDNAGSSVKSKAKANCICAEYAEIWRVANEQCKGDSSLAMLIPAIQFNGYDWNLNRLSDKLKHEFFSQYVQEFQGFQQAGLLDESQFLPGAWQKLEQILDDPDGYFARTYGPACVTRTCILALPETMLDNIAEAVSTIEEALGDDSEVLVDCPDSGHETLRAALDGLKPRFPNVHAARDSFATRTLKDLDADCIRGKTALAVWWDNGADDLRPLIADCLREDNAIVNAAHGSRAASYDSASLLSLELPLVTSLLSTSFYLDRMAPPQREGLGSKATGDCEIAGDAIVEDHGLADFEKARDSFSKLAHSLLGLEYREGVQAKRLLSPTWTRLQTAFDLLSFDARNEAGPRPSPSTLPSFMYDNRRPCANAGDCPPGRPQVTVIIPVYNSQGSVIECLESVLLQTGLSLQVVCVDDGSADRSLYVLEQFAKDDDRLSVITQFNGGAGAARNAAIAIAEGEFLTFIDSDDVFPNESTLQTLYRTAVENGASICGGSFSRFGADGNPECDFPDENRAYVFTEDGFRDFAEDQFDYGWIRFIYRREFFEAGARFNEFSWYEDPIFFSSIIESCPRYYAIPEITYCYHENPDKGNRSYRQVRDLLKGILHNLEFAERHGYSKLLKILVKRLNVDFHDTILGVIDDDEVFYLLLQIQAAIFKSSLRDRHLINASNSTVLVLEEMHSCSTDNAIIRFAKKVGGSPAYRSLQEGIWSIRERLSKSPSDSDFDE